MYYAPISHNYRRVRSIEWPYVRTERARRAAPWPRTGTGYPGTGWARYLIRRSAWQDIWKGGPFNCQVLDIYPLRTTSFGGKVGRVFVEYSNIAGVREGTRP